MIVKNKKSLIVIIVISLFSLLVLWYLFYTGKIFNPEPNNLSTVSEWRSYLKKECAFSTPAGCGYFSCYINGDGVWDGDLVGFVKADNTPHAKELCSQLYEGGFHYELDRAF